MTRRVRTTVPAALVVSALVLAACSGGGDAPSMSDDVVSDVDRQTSIGESSEGSIGPALPPDEEPVAGTNALPPVDVIDVVTEETVNIGTLLPARKPLLVWFWAPH